MGKSGVDPTNDRLRLLAVERILYINPKGVTIEQIIQILYNEFNILSQDFTIKRDLKALSFFYKIEIVKKNRKAEKVFKIKNREEMEKWNLKLKLTT